MTKAVVTVDTYRYHETYGDANSPILEAGKGDTIDVSEKEFERGAGMDPPALAKPSSGEAKDAKTAGEPGQAGGQ